jgi:hypothetical protein
MNGDFNYVLYFVGGYSVVVLTSLWVMLGHRAKLGLVGIRKR